MTWTIPPRFEPRANIAGVDRGHGEPLLLHGVGLRAEAWAAQIACPALFLAGALDANSTPATSVAMAAATRRGRVVVLPGQRHMASMVAPEAVGDVIAEWLAEPVESLRAAAS